VIRPWLRSAWLGLALALGCLTHTSPSAAADEESSSEGAAKSDDSAATDGERPKADEPKGDKAAGDDGSDDKAADLGHMGQFGLRVGLVAGFRMVLRYSDSPFCTEPDLQKPLDKQQKFCGHTAPLATDFGLSFALLDFVEPFVWARLGLGPEKETDTKALVVIGAGVRIYTMSDAAFKVFIEPAVGWELERGRKTPAWQLNDPEYDRDFVFHIALGPQYDFTPNVGAYLSGGVSASVLRYLGSSLDLNLGVQGRYP